MKRYDDYTPAELLELDRDEIEKLVDLECAFRGVALLPESPEPPTEVKAGPDVTVYNAGGKMFREEADAQKVVDLINDLPYLETYYLSGGYSYSGPQGVKQSEKEHDMEAVRESRYWTPAHYDKHRAALAEYKEAKARYDTDRKDYERILGERSGVAEEIAAIRQKAQDERDTIADIEREFKRYVQIAAGDRDQALKFYLHARDDADTEDYVQEILGFNDPKEALDTPTEG